MPKLLALDCDGTIRQTRSGATFINDPDDQEPIPGASEAIRKHARQGWYIVGVTNQGGVAKGFKSLDNAIEEQRITLSLFPEMQRIYLCPDFAGEVCVCVERNGSRQFNRSDYKNSNIPCFLLYESFRKPGSGMLMLAEDELIADSEEQITDCWMIGDRSEDQQAALAANFNYLNAQMWRQCNLPGIHKFDNVNPKQLEFLERYKVSSKAQTEEVCWKCHYNMAAPGLKGLCVSCVD